MIKKIVSNFVLFFLLLSIINFSFANNVNLEKKCLMPCVKLLSSSKKSIGSGVIVKSFLMKNERYSNVVVSCYHVTNNQKIIIEVPSLENKNEYFYGTAIYENQEYDISIVIFSSEKEQIKADLDLENDIVIGDDILGVGYGLSSLPKLGFGKIITQKQKEKSFKDSYFTNIPMVMGDSGGPVYKNNKLIALSQAIRVVEWQEKVLPFPNISVVIPIKKLIELNKIEKGKLDFVIKKDSQPPMFPHLFLEMQEFDNILIK